MGLSWIFSVCCSLATLQGLPCLSSLPAIFAQQAPAAAGMFLFYFFFSLAHSKSVSFFVGDRLNVVFICSFYYHAGPVFVQQFKTQEAFNGSDTPK